MATGYVINVHNEGMVHNVLQEHVTKESHWLIHHDLHVYKFNICTRPLSNTFSGPSTQQNYTPLTYSEKHNLS